MDAKESRSLKLGNHYAVEYATEERAPNGREYTWWIALLGEKGSADVHEELDVYGTSREAARKLANEIIGADYQDGTRIVKLVLA